MTDSPYFVPATSYNTTAEGRLGGHVARAEELLERGKTTGRLTPALKS